MDGVKAAGGAGEDSVQTAPAADAREARERQIVEGAVAYFAEVGLDGQTRELARRLGITQPLLFRYFPTKAVA